MTFRRFFLFLLLIGIAIVGWAYWTAIADPVVRETRWRWPIGRAARLLCEPS